MSGAVTPRTMQQVPDTPRRGRPPLTSREAILDAVLAIGLDRATTSAVAERLGVDQSTLYRHIANREEMLDAAVEVAAARVSWPEPGEDWEEYLRDCAQAMWAVFSTTPGIVQRLRSMTSMPEAFVVHGHAAVGYLARRLSLSLREAVLIIDTIGDMTADSYATIELLDRQVLQGRTGRDLALERMERAGVIASDPITTDDYLDVLRGAMGEPGVPSTWWMDKVDLVIDGVKQRIERRRPDAESS